MYYRDIDDIPWYRDGRIWLVIIFFGIVLLGLLTGDIRPECMHMECK